MTKDGRGSDTRLMNIGLMEPPELSLEVWQTVIEMLKAKRLNTNDKMGW